MAKPGTVTGWKLPRDEREQLLRRFPPKYENVIADHVTLRTGATPATPLPRRPEARIASTLAHGNIAQVFEYGEEDGTPFLAMELVETRDVAVA